MQPGAVAELTDDGLNDESSERRSQPEAGDFGIGGAEVGVDGGHVGHLEAPSELDAEESEVHVEDGAEGKFGFGGAHGFWVGFRSGIFGISCEVCNMFVLRGGGVVGKGIGEGLRIGLCSGRGGVR